MNMIILPFFHSARTPSNGGGDSPEDKAMGVAVLLFFCVASFFGGDFVGMLIGQHLSDVTEQRLAKETKELRENAARAATWAYELNSRHAP